MSSCQHDLQHSPQPGSHPVLLINLPQSLSLSFFQVTDAAKRDELAGLFGLTQDDIADISKAADKEAEKAKEEEEAFFL